jgi:hypothetical protein
MIRLADLLEERTVALGYGVSVTLAPVGYADLKAAEVTAIRRARDRLNLDDARDLVAGEDVEAREGRIAGLAEEIMLDELVRTHVRGWSGVMDEDGKTPAPLTPETWARFRRGVPFLADRLRAEMRLPSEMIVAEGNG